MSERREIYVELSSETYAGTEFPAAESYYIVRPAPDAVQAQARIAALEAALDEIRIIARSVLEIMSDRQKRWNGKELYQIAKKAEAALEVDVKE